MSNPAPLRWRLPPPACAARILRTPTRPFSALVDGPPAPPRPAAACVPLSFPQPPHCNPAGAPFRSAHPSPFVAPLCHRRAVALSLPPHLYGAEIAHRDRIGLL